MRGRVNRAPSHTRRVVLIARARGLTLAECGRIAGVTCQRAQQIVRTSDDPALLATLPSVAGRDRAATLCQECGVEFSGMPSRIAQRRFCSSRCWSAWRRRTPTPHEERSYLAAATLRLAGATWAAAIDATWSDVFTAATRRARKVGDDSAIFAGGRGRRLAITGKDIRDDREQG